MPQITRNRSYALAMTINAVLALALTARADDAPKHGAPLQGGKVAMTKEYHFEAVFTKDGVKLYPRTHADKPLNVSRLSGTATFYHPNSPKPWFEQKLTPTAAAPGRVATSLDAAIGLSKVPAAGAKVEFKVAGLPEPDEATATFTLPFVFAASTEMVFAKATKDDEKAIAAQKVCAVSRGDLFAMGGPIKVTRGDKSVFLCCKGCLKEIQANPDKFFGKLNAGEASKP